VKCAVNTIVDHQHNGLRARLVGSGKFLAIQLKITITRKTNYLGMHRQRAMQMHSEEGLKRYRQLTR